MTYSNHPNCRACDWPASRCANPQCPPLPIEPRAGTPAHLERKIRETVDRWKPVGIAYDLALEESLGFFRVRVTFRRWTPVVTFLVGVVVGALFVWACLVDVIVAKHRNGRVGTATMRYLPSTRFVSQ